MDEPPEEERPDGTAALRALIDSAESSPEGRLSGGSAALIALATANAELVAGLRAGTDALAARVSADARARRSGG